MPAEEGLEARTSGNSVIVFISSRREGPNYVSRALFRACLKSEPKEETAGVLEELGVRLYEADTETPSLASLTSNGIMPCAVFYKDGLEVSTLEGDDILPSVLRREIRRVYG